MKTLKEVRESKGIKIGYVADQLGISRQTYSKYEENQEKMTISQAKAVCEILGCSIEEIFLTDSVN